MSTGPVAAEPPEAAAAKEPSRGARPWRWLRALSSPAREIVLSSLIVPIAIAAIAPAREWFLDRVGLGPGPSGSLVIVGRGGGMSRAEFAKLGGPASASAVQGLVFEIRLAAAHAGRCAVDWTIVNTANGNPLAGFSSRPATVYTIDPRSCPATTRVWVPLPALPPHEMSVELDLRGGGRSLDVARSSSFVVGGV
jgi:hypothetical protein